MRAPKPLSYTITSVSSIADKDALNALLFDYYTVIISKFPAAGVPPNYSQADLMASFWPNVHKILPPTGRLMLAHDPAGRLVGCGTLHQARPDAGELKRLFVRPEAAGHGLGRKLVDARIEAARDMGWRHLLVNTLIGNQDMLRIYEKIGFRFIDRYPECSDPDEIADRFVYMQYDLES
jgi:GNAT superfamily N-acetyltransferase